MDDRQSTFSFDFNNFSVWYALQSSTTTNAEILVPLVPNLQNQFYFLNSSKWSFIPHINIRYHPIYEW